MTIQQLRDKFTRYMLSTGHQPLPELSLVTPDAETFFTMAAVKGVTDLFRENVEPEHPNLFVMQRMFSANQIEFAGRYPLSTPMEVQMSAFRFRDRGPGPILQLTLDFLEQELGIAKDRLYFLAPQEYGIYEALQELRFPLEHVITWNKPLAYKMGEEGPFGHYGRFFLKHRHGVFPIVDLTFVSAADQAHLFVESCFYLDRLYFAKSGEHTWFETPLYASMLTTFGECEYETAILTRALVALIGDGLVIGAKGPGYVARKMIRQVVTHWWTVAGVAPKLSAWVEPALAALQFLGYDYRDDRENIQEVLAGEEELALGVLSKAEVWVQGQVAQWPADPAVACQMLLDWKESRGIPEVVALRVLERSGIDTEPVRKLLEQPERFYLKMAGYPFEADDPIEDPANWLLESEERRYATRKK